MVNMITGRKLHMTDSNFLQLIISFIFHYFSCHCFLYVHFKLEFTVFSQVSNTTWVSIVWGFWIVFKIYSAGYNIQVVRNFYKTILLFIYTVKPIQTTTSIRRPLLLSHHQSQANLHTLLRGPGARHGPLEKADPRTKINFWQTWGCWFQIWQ